MKKTFTSKDFYLCAYLIANGYELQGHYREKGFTSFHFEWSEEIMNLTKKFYSLQAQVEPIKYSQSIRSLKSAIHSLVSTSNQDTNNELIQISKGTK